MELLETAQSILIFVYVRLNLLNFDFKAFQMFVFFRFFRKCLFFADLFLLLFGIILCYEGHQLSMVLFKLDFRLVQNSGPTVLLLGQLSYLLLDSFVGQFSMEHLLLLVDEFVHVCRTLVARELHT